MRKRRLERQLWDVSEFAKVQIPVRIEHDLHLSGNPEGVRVLDMPIHIPREGFAIPDEISSFMPIINSVIEHERGYHPLLDSMYMYITVDQKVVLRGRTGRRAGAHSDGYVETSDRQVDIVTENAHLVAKETGPITHTYIWYDCLPTEFFRAKFPLMDPSDRGSLKTFDEIADFCTPDMVVTYPCRDLLFLTPYVVHRCAVADKNYYRTFVKISVSDRRFTRRGNTENPIFDYDWVMSKRSPSERNTPWGL